MPIYTPGKVVLRKGMGTWAEGGDLVYFIEVGGVAYRVHEFKTVGTTSLNVVSGGNFEYLVVAGGGGGGNSGANNGSGGGAGGLLSDLVNLSAGAATVIVGAGGIADNPGSNSQFSSLIAIGDRKSVV